MFKKISIILILAVLLAGFLFGRHLFKASSNEPLLVDRLPEADFLVRADILKAAADLSGMLHYNKLPFRDFLSQEFLLGQAKSYGLNFQRPVYLFAHESGEWGALIHVTDSSKVSPGLLRLQKIVKMSDTVMYNQSVYHNKKENIYLTYGKNYLFVYKGNQYKKQLFHVVHAQKGEVGQGWNSFLNASKFRKDNLVLFSNAKRIQKYGFEKGMFSLKSDSTSFTMQTYIRNKEPWNLEQKKQGLSIVSNQRMDRSMNLHLNIQEFRNQTQTPLYGLLEKWSRKISFPLAEFLEAWEGNISFQQGGIIKVKETFIESVLDENFFVSEVESTREVDVPGFALALSMNKNGPTFMTKLLNKGILTQQETKYRFLVSPLLNFQQKGDYFIFYSGAKSPELVENTEIDGLWSVKGTTYFFQLEKLTKQEAFGKIQFPVARILKRNKFL